jgi:F-type H+-transporting ATPase subunit delta
LIRQSIARRYAKALFSVGVKDGKYREYLVQLDETLIVLKKAPKLDRALTMPLLEMEKRREILVDLTRALGLSATLIALLGLLLERSRMNYLPMIRAVYEEMANDKEGLVKGIGYSAYPLSDEAKVRIEEVLGEKLNKKVLLDIKEDKDLIGGIKVVIGGLRIDGSVKRQLEILNESMMKE